MNYNKPIFIIIELMLFVLPAVPESVYVRFSVLFIYFIAHYFKLQIPYSKFKSQFIK